VGYHAGIDNTSGEYNTFVGRKAGFRNSTGLYGVCIGVGAGSAAGDDHATEGTTCVGYNAGGGITTGDNNTVMGHLAADVLATGARCVILGYAAAASANNVDDEIVIGSNATGKGTDTSFISANGGPIYAGNNSASLSTTSDRRIKKNIEDNNIGLDKINQIQVRNFEYRLPEEVDPELPQSAAIDKEGVQLGVIAQEAMEILPDIVKQESTGCYTVDPDNITWYLVNAVKELSAKVDELENNKCKCKE